METQTALGYAIGIVTQYSTLMVQSTITTGHSHRSVPYQPDGDPWATTTRHRRVSLHATMAQGGTERKFGSEEYRPPAPPSLA
jgi:hypothetical protein